MKKEERPILLVDATNLFMRHFAANPSLSVNGEPVGGIVGFLGGIKNLVKQMNPQEVIIVWEGGGSTRRRNLFKDYKQGKKPIKLNRFYDNEELPDTVENKNNQIGSLIQLLHKTPFKQIYVPQCEADDVIGYYCKNIFENQRIIIISSDKDYFQLLTKKIIQWSPSRNDYVTMKTILKDYNIHPNNFALARAVAGDPSDSIPGVPRVGLKMLSKKFPMLLHADSVSVTQLIESAKENRDSGKKSKIFSSIIDNEDIIRRNWKLMYLDTNNLAASQIKILNDLEEKSNSFFDKIGIIRLLLKLGINTFDIGDLQATIKFNARS